MSGTCDNAKSDKFTEKYVERAYLKAKKLAANYYKTHGNTYVDEADLVQGAMVAFLEGRSMKFGLIDEYRAAAPLTRWQIGKIPPPLFQQIFEYTLITNNALDHAVLLRQLSEVIAQMEPITQDVLDRYYLKEQTFETIGKAFNRGRNWASNLIKDAIHTLQKEFCDDRV